MDLGRDRADGRERVDAGGRADPRRGASRTFTVTTRNVAKGRILAWLVQDDAEALNKARNQVEQHEVPSEITEIEIPFNPEAKRTSSSRPPSTCSRSLSPGKNYILSLVLDAPAFDALPVKYPSWMSASRSPLTLVTPGDERGDRGPHPRHPGGDAGPRRAPEHRRTCPRGQLHAQRQGARRPGAPTPTASRCCRSAAGQVDTGLLMVKDGETTLQVPLKPGNRDARLFPQYAAESAPALGDRRALVITDRGIYRPGSKVFIKASVRRKLGEQIVPLAGTPVHVRVLGPTDDELADLALVTDDMGSVAGEYQIPAEARVGRHRIEVAEASDPEKVLAEDVIQVAEFEPPRFTVDVDATVAASNTLRAKVLGKYLFGAAMDGAEVAWTLNREDAEPARRPVHRRRLSLHRQPLQLVGRGAGARLVARRRRRARPRRRPHRQPEARPRRLGRPAEVHLRGRRRRQLVPPHRRPRQRRGPPGRALRRPEDRASRGATSASPCRSSSASSTTRASRSPACPSPRS
jgi:hypothetical protein